MLHKEIISKIVDIYAKLIDTFFLQRNKRNKGKQLSGSNNSGEGARNIDKTNDFTEMSPKSLWKQIKEEADAYFRFNLNLETATGTLAAVDAVCENYNLQKLSLLRSVCMKTGIQLQLREYIMDAKHSLSNPGVPVFGEEDIVNVFPVVKHINPRATDAYNFYTTGQSKIQQGFLKDGYELINEALNLLNNVYGAMHPEIAQCLRMLARLNYIMGEHGEAMQYQQKAVLMSERVNGIDHPYTITEYTHLALYCFANSQIR